MKSDLLDILRCPSTGLPLLVTDAHYANNEIETGTLVTTDGTRKYPIVDYIPRFVPLENYASSFGLQWNEFRRTQLDSATGLPISRDQFYGYTGWHRDELRGKQVLDVGCGAGRFTEVALAAEAHVVALDYSTAVDACWANHRFHPLLDVVQADIYHLPFARGRFDFVYCIGVLQHTPDVKSAFLALPPQLTAGGRLAVGLYAKILLNLLWPKYWLRPLTRRISPATLFRIVQRAVPVLLPMSRMASRVPGVGRWLRWAVPVSNHELDWPLSSTQVKEWAVLNTFDMFSPQHDQPQSAGTLRLWTEEAGLEDVFIERHGFLVVRGRVPPSTGIYNAGGP